MTRANECVAHRFWGHQGAVPQDQSHVLINEPHTPARHYHSIWVGFCPVRSANVCDAPTISRPMARQLPQHRCVLGLSLCPEQLTPFWTLISLGTLSTPKGRPDRPHLNPTGWWATGAPCPTRCPNEEGSACDLPLVPMHGPPLPSGHLQAKNVKIVSQAKLKLLAKASEM
jgi:hypothetical protein